MLKRASRSAPQNEVEAGDEPADLVRMLWSTTLKTRRAGATPKLTMSAEGIELAAEGAFLAAEAGEPAVEQIENAGGEDAVDC